MSLIFTNKEEGRISVFKNLLLSGDKDICTSVYVAGQSQDGHECQDQEASGLVN